MRQLKQRSHGRVSQPMSTAEARRHQEWHSHMCCTEQDHPGLPMEEKVQIRVPLHMRIALQLPSSAASIYVSPLDVLTKADENAGVLLGGCLFRHPERWQSLNLAGPSRTSQKEGGVPWRMKLMPQQNYRLPKPQSEEEMWHTQLRMEELFRKGAYSVVTETLEEEEATREEARQRYKDRHRRKKPHHNTNATSASHCSVSHRQMTTQTCNSGNSTARPAQIYYADVYTILKSNNVDRRLLQDHKANHSNKAVWKRSRKQDGVESLQGMIRPGDRFFLLDFEDCFHQFRVHERMKAMLRCHLRMCAHKGMPPGLRRVVRRLQRATNDSVTRWVVVRMQCEVLTQGFTESPGIATVVLGDVMKLLRSVGIRVKIKIDDVVGVVDMDPPTAIRDMWCAVHLLIWLGAKLKAAKGMFHLPHRVEWHGKVFCSIVQVTSDVAEKIVKKVELATLMLSLIQSDHAVITLRVVARVCGVMLASIDSIAAMRIRTMELCWLKTIMFRDPNWQWDKKIPVSSIPKATRTAVAKECSAWIENHNRLQPERHTYNGKFHYHDSPVATVYTDACNWQKGTWVAADPANGHPEIDSARPFVGREIHDHITIQETVAAVEGIIHTIKERNYSDCVINSRIDATAAVKYVRCLGGKKRKFTQKTVVLHTELKRRRILLQCSHVPGVLNPADAPSRRVMGPKEWKLNIAIFHQIQARWGPIGIDLMASEWNAQVPRYATLDRADSKAVAVDALTYPLHEEQQTVYAFPPPHRNLCTKLVSKITAALVQAVVVLPAWPLEFLSQAVRNTDAVPMVIMMANDTLTPPEAYMAHQHDVAFRQDWTPRTYKALVGVSIAREHSSAKEFRNNWRRQLMRLTKRTRQESVVATLIQHGHSSDQPWESCMEQLRLISNMILSCVI